MSYPLNRYVPGTYKRECDRCGFDYLRSELTKEERTGLIVCDKCHDPLARDDRPRQWPRIRPFKRD